MTTAVAYIRVSKEEQHLGPDAQRSAIELWAKTNGATIAAWFTDQGFGGGLDIEDRPALVEAIGALGAHQATVLVVAKRDRLARDTYIATTIERSVARHGARVMSAAGEGNGDTPADEFLRCILDGAAAYERALIRARTKAALAAKKAKGERVGGVPFGFTVGEGGKLEADAHEQAIVRRVVDLAGTLSIRAIVRLLEAEGVRARTGKALGYTQVRRMLVNARKEAA